MITDALNKFSVPLTFLFYEHSLHKSDKWHYKTDEQNYKELLQIGHVLDCLSHVLMHSR